MNPIAILAAVTCVLAPCVAVAHHGWSSYDATKGITVTAPLSDVAWRNPHGTAKVVHQRKTWDVVLAPVARMESRGLSVEMLGPGKTVTLEGFPRRDGVLEMRVERITVGGKTVELR
ncbi:MAG: DUF6152 family protein [Phenylobacterium sp.]|uniref:DUF6152 family protein n=1 Tax=Phenylobacterium sp. TaxID=1871053 RepID=UPI002735CCEB|nr:DUF6152 family protein [Phenylobacterium sp.]MDP3173551.1 DUF6152 family protein [Phenylobacterium sp.]